MRSVYKILLVALCVICCLSLTKNQVTNKTFDINIPITKSSAVTYTFSGGRLGDNLLSYLHAKWISFLHNIPLLYASFTYSHSLKLHDIEKYPYQKYAPYFTKTHVVAHGEEMNIDPQAGILYIVHYFPEVDYEEYKPRFKVDWHNKQFKALVQQLIAPRKAGVGKATLSKSRVNVALHMRKGGGFDRDGLYKVYQSWPEKFPEDEYYIEQIKKMYELCNNAPLHIHIFTDDRDPALLMKKLSEAVKPLNIEFSCRVRGNKHDAHVLDDLFAMAKFDCLIRPDSNFSVIAEKIGDYKFVIAPERFVDSDTGTKHIWGKVVQGIEAT